MKRLAMLGSALFLFVSCGGAGDNDAPTRAADQQRAVGAGQATADLESTESIVFRAQIKPGSIVQQELRYFSAAANEPLRNAYLIRNLDSLQHFNRLISNGPVITPDDLATHTYFLIAASPCPAASDFAGADYAPNEVTIKINRYAARSDIACVARSQSGYHVLKAAKSEAPQILFASLEPQTPSAIAEERFVVVKDNTAFADLWAEHHRNMTPAPPLPMIDFSQNMVVGVYLGSRPSGCHGVRITRIVRSAGTNIVQYSEQVPGPDSICTMALVFPSHLVVVPKTDTPFEFRKVVRTVDPASKVIN